MKIKSYHLLGLTLIYIFNLNLYFWLSIAYIKIFTILAISGSF